ncbi:MAG: 2-phospho-L-lactate guanylyltransferase [Pseudomonadales bacterium]
MPTDTIAIVPFRSLRGGKNRLAPHLENDSRPAFVEAMLRDTLQALRCCEDLDRVMLVSNDSEAAALAREMGVIAIAEPQGCSGLNPVVQMTARELGTQCKNLMIVHGDLPILHPDEVKQLLDAHASVNCEAKLTIASDRHQSGTNCLLVSPPTVMRFYYGTGSLAKHLAFADKHNIQSQVIDLPGAGLDIDEIADLQLLKQHEQLATAEHVHKFLMK